MEGRLWLELPNEIDEKLVHVAEYIEPSLYLSRFSSQPGTHVAIYDFLRTAMVVQETVQQELGSHQAATALALRFCNAHKVNFEINIQILAVS